jgi:hypothetical protein
VSAALAGNHAQALENIGVNSIPSVDGRIVQHVKFFA